MRLPIFCCVFLALSTAALAEEEFDRLVHLLPRSANAVMLLNVDKAIASPMGKFEGWKENLEKMFDAGVTRVPPQAKRFVLAAEVDFEFLKPLWEAAVVDSRELISMSEIAKRRKGTIDTIESHAAIALPEDVYLIQFDDTTLGAIGPANRKLATSWLRDIEAGLKLSSYLDRAAYYSDTSGSEIIIAVDLDGAFALESAVAYLKTKPGVVSGQFTIQQAAAFLAGVKGIRLGIRLTQPPTAAVAVDCGEEIELSAEIAKRAMLQVLADSGTLVPEMRDWTPAVKGTQATLSGKLSKSGLRRFLSLIESPTASQPASTTASATKSPIESPSETSLDPQQQMAQATLKHYKSVVDMFDDLKGDMKDAANLAVTSTYFDRYAKRIERLPLLDVDPSMLDYSGYVAGELRAAAGAVRTMGIRGNSRQHQINYNDIEYDYAYGYRAGWYGESSVAVPVNDGVGAVKAVGAERRKIRAEEKGVAATDVHQIRANVIDATSKIRRAMSEKYRINF
jgi:hypothetical protein